MNTCTHPHGWRDARGAGPEGAVVPGDGRLELQLVPLLLEERRTRKERRYVGVVAVVPGVAACLLLCLMAHRWPTQHAARGHQVSADD